MAWVTEKQICWEMIDDALENSPFWWMRIDPSQCRRHQSVEGECKRWAYNEFDRNLSRMGLQPYLCRNWCRIGISFHCWKIRQDSFSAVIIYCTVLREALDQALGESNIPHELEYMRNLNYFLFTAHQLTIKSALQNNHRYASYQFPSHNINASTIINIEWSHWYDTPIATATKQLGRGNPLLSNQSLISLPTRQSGQLTACPSVSTEPRWIARSTVHWLPLLWHNQGKLTPYCLSPCWRWPALVRM